MPAENVLPDPFLHRSKELSKAVIKAERAVDELWRLINDCMESFETLKHGVGGVSELDEPIKTLGCIRSAAASSQNFYETLRYNHATSSTRINHFRARVDELRNLADRSAMKSGIDRLPNELLLQILLESVEGLKSTIAISHVCRRFRSIVIGSHKFWETFMLSSRWSCEQIQTMAGRSAPQPLQATILCPESTTLGLPESIAVILSLDYRILSLSLRGFDERWQGTLLRWRLEHAHFPILKTLISTQSVNVISSFPQALFDMPSLQVLDVDFIPSPFQAGSLVELFLAFELEFFSLRELLVFLSSANKLQELNIYVDQRLDEDDDAQAIFMPNLSTLRFSTGPNEGIDGAAVLVEKIRSPTFRRLGVHFTSGHPELDEDSITDILLGSPTIRYLEMSGPPRIDLQLVPQSVEELTVGGFCSSQAPLTYTSGPLSSHQIRVVRFKRLSPLPTTTVKTVRDLFLAWGNDNDIVVCFEFEDCPGFRDGTFDLVNIESAFISH